MLVQRSPRISAFTLVELLAVLAIVAALSGLILGVSRHAVQSSRSARAQAELAVLAAALEIYKREQGDYPRTADPAALLQALIGRRDPLNRSLATHSYVDLAQFATVDRRDPFSDATACIADPWGEPYDYAYQTVSPWQNPGFVLQSAGPNGLVHPALLAGGYVDVAQEANADNVAAPR